MLASLSGLARVVVLGAGLLVGGVAVAGKPTESAEPRPVTLSETQRAFFQAAFEQEVMHLYVQAGLAARGLQPDVLRRALIGYYNLQQAGRASRPVLTIVDFSLPSRQKRLWVVDLQQRRVLHHTLVAHGKNTGNDLARTFSNTPGSEMSSLGFYVTGQPYQGKHGLSLKLHGQDAAYNSNAAERAVVVHGAPYVSEDFVRQHGRLGRSQGCPALPEAETPHIVRAIEGGSVLYAHAPTTVSFASNWLQLDGALWAFARQHGLRLS